MLSQYDLTVFHKAQLSQSSSAPINVECGGGQVTVEDRPGHSGLLDFLWSSDSCVKALRCVSAYLMNFNKIYFVLP